MMFFGIAPPNAFLASAVWCFHGALGAVVLQRWISPTEFRQRIAMLLGPGPLIGMALVMPLYLFVGGSVLGTAIVIIALFGGVVNWLLEGKCASDTDFREQMVVVGVFTSAALFANINELPIFLLPALGVLSFSFAIRHKIASWKGAVATSGAVLLLALSVRSRPSFWWATSDDTATLAGIGTMIIQRGQISDVAGWPTTSHHWFLQAWLGLWNHLSDGHIFETYLIAVPIVLTLSIVASLWLLLSGFLAEQVSLTSFMITTVAVAGVARIGWPAPHQQHPYFFAMLALAGVFVSQPARMTEHRRAQANITYGVLVIGSAILFVYLKPTLLAALGLILCGVVLVRMRPDGWSGLLLAAGLSGTVIAGGLLLMHVASGWVSERSFADFSVDYFPPELGWCTQSSLISSIWCVISSRILLLVSFILAIVIWNISDFSRKSQVRIVLLLPLIFAFLPFRFFVSASVATVAELFVQLGEVGVVIFIAVVLCSATTKMQRHQSVIVGLVGVSLGVMLATKPIDWIDELVSPYFARLEFSRFMPSVAVIALTVGSSFAVLVAQLYAPLNVPLRRVIAIFVVVSLLPFAGQIQNSVVWDPPVEQLSRPEFLGPPDIEDIGRWLQENTSQEALLATNYLCESSRLAECSRVVDSKQCPRDNPSLMASWALTALSEREFLYLSQNWVDKPHYFQLHESSTRLSSALGDEDIDQLLRRGVTYFVASRMHTSSNNWNSLLAYASFTSENFVVVDLETLRKREQT